MLLEISNNFWINPARIALINTIRNEKDEDEWHVYFEGNLKISHLILSNEDMKLLTEALRRWQLLLFTHPPCAPSSCL